MFTALFRQTVRLLALTLAVSLLAGCDLVEDMQGMMERSQKASLRIASELDIEPSLSFNMRDGQLAHVEVTIPGAPPSGADYNALVARLTTIIEEEMGSRPAHLDVKFVVVAAPGANTTGT